MATFYGSDTGCVSDLPLVDVQVTNPNILIGQRIARILQTDRGGFGAIGDDPNRGWNTRQLLNAKLAPGQITGAQQQIVNECLKDEEVFSAVCSIANPSGSGSVSVAVSLVGSNGPFSLVLNVGQLTTDLVFNP